VRSFCFATEIKKKKNCKNSSVIKIFHVSHIRWLKKQKSSEKTLIRFEIKGNEDLI
jgi:hypothetical protein